MKKKIQLLMLSLFACNILLAQTPSVTITGGGDHSLVVCNGSPISFGQNSVGQLGDGTTNNSSTPLQINTLESITAVAAGGGSKSLFLKNDSSVWACGDNSYGQLGDGTLIDRHTPIQINSLSKVTAIAGQDFHSLFLKDDGTVWATGQNLAGALGIGTNINTSTPTLISTLNNVVAIAAGQNHSLFLKNDGTVWSCGANSYGELGNGNINQNFLTPIQVNNLFGIVAIAAGTQHSLFLKNDGTVWGCGYNGRGQLGDGTLISSSIPIQIPNFNNIEFIAAGGGQHSVFLKNDKTVWACGANDFGQLGDGSIVDKTSPIQITTLDSIKGIAIGEGHSLFLKQNNTIWTCGWNTSGQLGDGTTTNRSTPVQILYSCAPPCVPPTLLTVAGNAAICNGSVTSFTVSAIGTNASTIYNWTGPNSFSDITSTITNVSDAGQYDCIISNGLGCSDTVSINLIVNPLPNIVANSNVDTICLGQSVTLTGGGADNYSWDNSVVDSVSFNPTSTNTYTVTGTDTNGCTNSASKAIIVNLLPIVIANSNIDTICSGQSVTLTGSGANTYSWDNNVVDSVSFNPTSTNTYNLTGTDTNGCTNTATKEITVNPLPVASIITANGNTNICIGDSLILNGNIGGTWNTTEQDSSILVFTSGNYFVTNTNSCGNLNSNQINVTVNPLPIPIISQIGNDITCQIFSSYQWFADSILIPLANNQIYTPLTSGIYTIAVIDSNGCTNISSGYLVTLVGIENINSISTIEIYPNPFENAFTLQIITPKQENVSVSLYNISGEVVKENSIISNRKIEFNTSDLPSGMYFMKASLNSGETKIIKVVKNN